MMRKIYYTLVLFFCATLSICGQDLFNTSRIPIIKISFGEADWDAKLDALKQKDGKGRLFASVSIDGVNYDSVGVRYKGNSSYFNVRGTGQFKLPFNLKSNEVRSKQFFPGGKSILKLANGFRDPTYLREVFAYELARQYMPASRANFVHLYINGKDYGLYTNTESVDEGYLKERFGGYSSGTLFKCDPNWDAKDVKGCPAGDKAALLYLGEDSTCYKPFYELDQGTWGGLIALTKTFKEAPMKIEEHLDIDRTLWMLAFNTVTVNLDSYHGRLCHNYYLYQDSSGRFVPIIWDLNLSFGGFAYDGVAPAPLTPLQLEQLSPFLHYDDPKRPLINVVLKNPTYRKLYIAHVRTILEEQFYNKQYLKRLQEMAKFIEPSIKTDSLRLYPFEVSKQNVTQPVEIGKNQLAGITSLMDKRTEFLRSHPLLKKEPPTIVSDKAVNNSGTVTITVQTKNAEKSWCCWRVNAAQSVKWTLMTAANTDTYSATIPFGAQYFIVAENDEAAASLPARSGTDWHIAR